LWHWGYYWHPGNSYNTAGCNKDAFNNAADGVQYANTQDDAVYNAIVAQQVFADAVLSVTVYAASGYKPVSRTYVGDEAGFTGEDWYGMVNWPGYGVDNGYTFMNMHTETNDLDGRIRYGFKTQDLRQMNPIYTEWLWDNTVIDLIGYDSLVARNPYTMDFVPWVSKVFTLGTYNHPTYGTCTKVAFTLRNDVYFQDGTQLTVADIAFTFIEIDDLLAARGLAPPWWISNVQNILSFSVLDPLNFEVLLDVKSIFALGWIGGNRILPKHIWKPIVTGVVAPKSGVAWDPTTFAPDPNLIGTGAWRLDEYVSNSHVLLQANRPGSVVNTGINTDPNANSVPITSTKGFFKLNPVYLNIHTDTYKAKIDPTYPNTAVDVHLNFDVANLWLSGALDVEKTVEVDGSVEIATHTVNIAAGVKHSEDITVNLAKCLHTIKLTVKILSAGPWQNLVMEITWPIWITIPEDITGTYYVNTQLLAPDCKVDLKDVFAAGKAFGSVPGDNKWNTGADINHDYKIDLKDYFAIAKKFGKW
jgi:hypothetical protein